MEPWFYRNVVECAPAYSVASLPTRVEWLSGVRMQVPAPSPCAQPSAYTNAGYSPRRERGRSSTHAGVLRTTSLAGPSPRQRSTSSRTHSGSRPSERKKETEREKRISNVEFRGRLLRGNPCADPAGAVHNVLYLHHCVCLDGVRVGHGHVRTRDALHRRIQVVEAVCPPSAPGQL